MPKKTPGTPAAIIETPSLVPAGTRKLKKPKYRSFRLQKKVPKDAARTRLPNAFKIFKSALGVIKRNWKPFLGIVVIYGILNLVLVKGLSSGIDINELKETVLGGSNGNGAKLVGGTVLFSYLVSTAGSTSSQSAGIFQIILALIMSLATIWTLRQVYAGSKVRIRDSFYKGMHPLIPSVLVVLVVFLQLLPFVIGAYLYSTVTTLGVSGAEMVIWAVAFFLLTLLTLYMLTSSLFALYIVCLPDMTPLKALRAARTLVRYRRLSVMRKILFLPLALIILSAIVMVPLIILVSGLAIWVFFILATLMLPVIHSYMYKLYRELL